MSSGSPERAAVGVTGRQPGGRTRGLTTGDVSVGSTSPRVASPSRAEVIVPHFLVVHWTSTSEGPTVCLGGGQG